MEKYPEIKKMTDFDKVSYFTSMHEEQKVFFDPTFNLSTSFTEKQVQINSLKNFFKLLMMTGVSAGFGVVMGMFMSSFEFNSTMGVDTERSTKS